MLTLGVIAALPRESKSLGVKAPAPMRALTLAGLGELVVSGMGPARARQAAQILADRGARQLVSWGFAGALKPGLFSGQLLCPEGIIDPLGRRYPVTATLKALCLIRVCPGAVTADLISQDRALFKTDQKLALYRSSGAVAVDMESAAIAEVARARGLEFVALRSVFDPADETLPLSFVGNVDHWGSVRLIPMASALLRRPLDVLLLPGLMRLARQSESGLKTMAVALHALTEYQSGSCQDDHRNPGKS